MFETGLRREGVRRPLRLGRGDSRRSVYGQYTVSILRRPDNPLDSRTDAPTPKTLERVIPITEELARVIMEYTVSHRGRAKNLYLFISRKGSILWEWMPLTRSSRLSGLHPDLANLAPHDARRTFNDRFFHKINK